MINPITERRLNIIREFCNNSKEEIELPLFTSDITADRSSYKSQANKLWRIEKNRTAKYLEFRQKTTAGHPRLWVRKGRPDYSVSVKFDKKTNEWFKGHPGVASTVCVCNKCECFFKPSLGHMCEVQDEQ